MMNVNDFWKFINDHIKEDPAALRLKYTGRSADYDIPSAILQIECRRKYGKKLEQTLSAFPHFMFPTALSGEQCSSDSLARWHASLVQQGSTAADLTAGLGIDAMHIARRAAEVTAVERSAELAGALNYNADGSGLKNLCVVNGDCRELVSQWAAEGKHLDTIFIDPARRGAQGERLFSLDDCEPSVISMFETLKAICNRLIIKASPMLDMSALAQIFPVHPEKIIALGTTTECKEVVAVINMGNEPEQTVFQAVTIDEDKILEFTFTRAQEAETPFPAPSVAVKTGNFIYEPYPAVMKAGGMKVLAQKFGLQGFAPNTRLLFSADRNEDFPGKVLEVLAVLPYASSVIKRFARTYPLAQVAVRNFDISAEELRRKLGVREGRDAVRVFGIKNYRLEPILVVTKPQ